MGLHDRDGHLLEGVFSGETAPAVPWGFLSMGRTAGGLYVPLRLLADGSVPATATVSGTVTADQGAAGANGWPVAQDSAGTEAWLTRADGPGVPTVFINNVLLEAASAWHPLVPVTATILNAAGDPGYDSIRVLLSLTPGAAGNIVEVRTLLSVDGANFYDAEEALDLTGVPAAGVLLTPAYARRREYTLGIGDPTLTVTWTVPLHGATHYRVQAREQPGSPGVAAQSTCTLTGAQFKD